MNDKENHEPGDEDFERFMRESSHTCIPFPLIVLREKMMGILTMYSNTLDGYIKIADAQTQGSLTLKNKLMEYLDKCAVAACETFEEFNFLLIDEDDDDDEGLPPKNAQN
jgi:hypothetical protein